MSLHGLRIDSSEHAWNIVISVSSRFLTQETFFLRSHLITKKKLFVLFLFNNDNDTLTESTSNKNHVVYFPVDILSQVLHSNSQMENK